MFTPGSYHVLRVLFILVNLLVPPSNSLRVNHFEITSEPRSTLAINTKNFTTQEDEILLGAHLDELGGRKVMT